MAAEGARAMGLVNKHYFWSAGDWGRGEISSRSRRRRRKGVDYGTNFVQYNHVSSCVLIQENSIFFGNLGF